MPEALRIVLTVLGFGVGGVLVLAAVIWLSHRNLRAAHRDGTSTSAVGDAFGIMQDLVSPANARAREDLDDAKRHVQLAPDTDAAPTRVRVDLNGGTIRLPAPRRDPAS
ncbi:hypothetical protein [Nocardioides sp.]|uniref:hypothetical protein n=1 Tax=Nocardioides sp. TaxID=35761 RepID=UPI003513CC4D